MRLKYLFSFPIRPKKKPRHTAINLLGTHKHPYFMSELPVTACWPLEAYEVAFCQRILVLSVLLGEKWTHFGYFTPRAFLRANETDTRICAVATTYSRARFYSHNYYFLGIFMLYLVWANIVDLHKRTEDGDGNVGKAVRVWITRDKKRTWICEIKLTFVPSCSQMRLQLVISTLFVGIFGTNALVLVE